MMSRPLRFLLDTNVVIDHLHEREPFYRNARLLMTCGRIGEFELWITSSQITDLVYILSDGGKASLIPRVLEQVKGLRTFVELHPTSVSEVDRMLETSWGDPEDALLYEAALDLNVDAIITRDKEGYEGNLVRTFDCEELFAWLKDDLGLEYEIVGY